LRFHLNFTPNSASWLNLVERFFRPDHAKTHPSGGVFGSVAELKDAIDYLGRYNSDSKLFRVDARVPRSF
jgi:hypothetical protein